MNASRTTEYDYINFVIATQYSYSCVEAARVQPEAADKPAHDSITRLLLGVRPNCAYKVRLSISFLHDKYRRLRRAHIFFMERLTPIHGVNS